MSSRVLVVLLLALMAGQLACAFAVETGPAADVISPDGVWCTADEGNDEPIATTPFVGTPTVEPVFLRLAALASERGVPGERPEPVRCEHCGLSPPARG